MANKIFKFGIIGLIMLVLISGFASAALNDGLNFYLDGTDYIDKSPREITILNTGTDIINDKYVFNMAQGDYINTTSEILGIGDKTIFLSMNMESFNSYTYILGNAYGISGNDEGFEIWLKDGKLNTAIGNSAAPGNFLECMGSILSVDTDYFILAKQDNNKLYVYVNDVFYCSDTVTEDNEVSSEIPYIIGSVPRKNYYFDGNITNNGLYNRSLSTSEATELYNKGGNPLPSISTIAGYDIAFKDEQTGILSFTVQDTYQEVLTASITINETYKSYIQSNVQLLTNSVQDVTCKVEINGNESLIGIGTTAPNEATTLSLIDIGRNITPGQYNLSLQCKKSGTTLLYIGLSRGIAFLESDDIQYSTSEVNTYLNGTNQIYREENFTAESDGTVILQAMSISENLNGTPQIMSRDLQVNNVTVCGGLNNYLGVGSKATLSTICAYDVVKDGNYTFRLIGNGSNINITHIGHIKLIKNASNVDITDTITTTPKVLGEINLNNNDSVDAIYLMASLQVEDNGGLATIKYEVNGVNQTSFLTTTPSNVDNFVMQDLVDSTSGINNIKIWGSMNAGTGNISSGQFVAYFTNPYDRDTTEFTVTTKDEWTGDSLTNFSVTYGELTISTTSGTLDIYSAQPLLNLTISADDYFNKNYLDHNTNNDLVAEIYQSNVTFDVYELITNDLLSGTNFTVDGTNGTEFRLNAGNHTILVELDDYYNLTTTFNISPLETGIINITGMYNSIFNFTATKAIIGGTVSNFSGWVYYNGFNESFSTTSGNAIVGIINRTGYTLHVESDGLASEDVTLNASVGDNPHEVVFFIYNSVYITFRDEETNNIINTQAVTLDFISETFADSYSTTNGTMYLNLLTPSDYVARYTSSGYTERFYYFTVVDDSTQNVSLYLLKNTSSTDIQVNVIDQNSNFVDGVYVKALKYDITTNTYKLQEIARTDSDGKVIMSLTKGDEFYKFQVEYDGSLILTTSPAYITSEEITLQIALGDTAGQEYFQFTSIEADLSFNNVTNNFRLTYNDANNLASNFCVYVYEYSAADKILINSGCNPTSSGTILVSLTPENGSYYIAEAFYNTESDPQFLIDAAYGTQNPISLGRLGLILQILITIVFCSAALFDVSLLPISMSLSLVMGRLVSLNVLPWNGIVVLVVVSVIIAWLIKEGK